MKTMTCKDLGGSCDATMEASTEGEMIQKGWEHLKEMHPETYEQTSQLPQEALDGWAKDFHAKWEATPETTP